MYWYDGGSEQDVVKSIHQSLGAKHFQRMLIHGRRRRRRHYTVEVYQICVALGGLLSPQNLHHSLVPTALPSSTTKSFRMHSFPRETSKMHEFNGKTELTNASKLTRRREGKSSRIKKYTNTKYKY